MMAMVSVTVKPTDVTTHQGYIIMSTGVSESRQRLKSLQLIVCRQFVHDDADYPNPIVGLLRLLRRRGVSRTLAMILLS